MALTEVRDRTGDMVTVDEDAAAHHWRCDGEGWTKTVDPADALPVACLVCRPVAAASVERSVRRTVVRQRRRLTVAR